MDHSMSTSNTGESPSPVILKRKRSKRYRTLALPPSNAVAATAASSASSDTTEEDHDLADCLILLAQGPSVPFKESATLLSRPAEPASLSVIFECKTCNKCFPSFQALGGHRSSHKKQKVTASETQLQGSTAKPIASSSSAGGRQRTHQCSMCGAEFSSGQALGGHMRRHRPALLLGNNLERENKVLLFDLNLPAPADDDDTFTTESPEDDDGDGGASRFLLLDY